MSDDADNSRGYFLTLTEQLTASFYQWEKRGRGWQVWGHPVDLEPVYRPFFHRRPALTTRADDGRQQSMLEMFGEKLRRLFADSENARQSPMLSDDGDFDPPPDEFADDSEITAISVSLFPDQKITVESSEQLLLGLAGCSYPVSFEIVSVTGRTLVQLACRRQDVGILLSQLHACFPEAVCLEGTGALADSWASGKPSVMIEFGLSCEFMRPLRTFRKLDPDPLTSLVGALDRLQTGEVGLLQILFQPAQHPWADDIVRAVTDGQGRSFFADCPEMKSLAEDKVSRPLFAVVIRVAGQARTASRAWEISRALGAALKQFDDPSGNHLIPLEPGDDEDYDRFHDILRRQSRRSGMLLNSHELLSLVHLPSESVRSAKLVRELKKTKAAPAPAEGRPLVLGENIHQGKVTTVALSTEQRLRHMYLVGASGTGKSTLLLNMILQDIAAGRGVGLLDPHGDLLKTVLERIPERRMNDVVLFDAADTEYPFALNILEAHDETERERIVAETIMALERYFPASWGPRLERILQYTLRTVLHAISDATLADVEQMLTDSAYRESVLAKTTDSRMLQFWTNQFKFFPKNATDPVLNKLSVFLLDRHVRNIICQRRSAIDFDRLLNEGKILLANLSTGLLTEKVSGTLGSFLVTKIVNAAFRRAALPEFQRRPWFLYVDEFQSFMNVSVGFERILAESRKYKLVLAGLANQYIGQLSPGVRQAIFGNVGTLVAFRLGVDDAQAAAKELGVFTADDVLNLEVGEAIARVGTTSTAFNLRTYKAPPTPVHDPSGLVIALARQRYARPRKEVEKELSHIAKAAARLESTGAFAGEPSDPDEDDLVT